MTAKADHVGYRFWHMYWADEKVHFEVRLALERGFYLCSPIKEDLDEHDDEVRDIVLSSGQIDQYKKLDEIFG